MSQVITFTNKKNEVIEFTDHSRFLIQKIDFGDVDADEITYKGFKQDGEVYQHSTLTKRQIVLKFALLCETVEELLEVRKQILRVFNPKIGQGLLKYCHYGVERCIPCVADRLPYMPLFPGRTVVEGEVILLAHDPYFMDINQTKVEIAFWQGAFKFPLSIPQDTGIVMGVRNPSLIVNVSNQGDVECGMMIEFIAKGTVENPSLFNVNTQEFIKVNQVMSAGEKITVSTGYGSKKIVSELNGVSKNIMKYLDLNSTFLQLEVGDNLFRYDADENLNQLEVNIWYTQRYLGV